MGYDFSIEFKRGKNNMVADALSRKDTQCEFNAVSSPLPQWLESINVENQSHPELKRIHHLHEQGEAIGPWENLNGVIFFKERIYLSSNSELILIILQEIYGTGHEGLYKTLHRVKEVLYWRQMRKFVLDYIKQCDVCQRHKIDHQKLAGLL